MEHQYQSVFSDINNNNSTAGNGVSAPTDARLSCCSVLRCINVLVSYEKWCFQTKSSTSLEALLATFIPSLTSALLLLLVFVIIKRPFRRIYSPRTYIDVIPEK